MTVESERQDLGRKGGTSKWQNKVVRCQLACWWRKFVVCSVVVDNLLFGLMLFAPVRRWEDME